MLAADDRIKRGLEASVRPVQRRRRPNGWTVFAYVLLTAGAILMVFPFIWMLLSSFKDAR